jgi:hypothetical protein
MGAQESPISVIFMASASEGVWQVRLVTPETEEILGN